MMNITTENEVHRSHKQATRHRYKYCGTEHARRHCPAFGKKCKRCHEWNHFTTECKSSPETSFTTASSHHRGKPNNKHVNKSYRLEENSEPDPESEDPSEECDENGRQVYAIRRKRTKYMVKAKLKTATQDNWVEIAMQIDNGSEVNCIRKQDLKQIDPKAEITRTKTTLRTYGNSQIHPLGTVQLVVCINNVQK